MVFILVYKVWLFNPIFWALFINFYFKSVTVLTGVSLYLTTVTYLKFMTFPKQANGKNSARTKIPELFITLSIEASRSHNDVHLRNAVG